MSVKLTFPEVIFCLHIILSCISHLRVLSASGRTLSGLVTDMAVTRWSEAKATKIWIILQVCECITRRTPHRKVSSHLKVLLTTASTTGFQSTECLLVPHCRGTGTQLELKCKDWRTVCPSLFLNVCIPSSLWWSINYSKGLQPLVWGPVSVHRSFGTGPSFNDVLPVGNSRYRPTGPWYNKGGGPLNYNTDNNHTHFLFGIIIHY